ncbi:protein Hook homolog 3 isoform X3 [Strongylocentrotus purpuratus]|uniref:Calponin-homology (CH) domain-containing protein n=1 Tax=Strongylocentrotus purpuratus TaxID=7668 RepID=A0A7M7PM04_STRPU|nr:protein Hook homolog 3 isoform X3 [Strongylocentrotus purpuratus]
MPRMADDELCESLLIWVQTFDLDAPSETIQDLTDGVALGEILCQIGSSFFTPSWFGRLKQDAGDSWRIRVSNLKKVQEGILDFYNEELGQELTDFQLPDLSQVGEHANPTELGRLLQLVLGCAVNCDHKEEYISTIMGLEESVQQVVMEAIQELMTKEIASTSPPPPQEALAHVEGQLKRTTEEKDEALQRCHELDHQVASLLEEKNALQAENEHLTLKLDHGDTFGDPSTPAGRRYQQLQATCDHLQEEMYRIEGTRDDYTIKVDMLQRENMELVHKNEQLQNLAEEARSLKDEMDILRHTSDKVSKYEGTIDTLKKKLEDLGDLKRQVKLLEDKNIMYMQNTMELEEELKKANALKSQLETYKRQVHELHSKMSEETRRADKAEFEATRAQEKTTQLQAEAERFRLERDSLKETNEELTLNQLQGNAFGEGGVNSSELGSSGLTAMLPPEVREKMIRLQHENKMLKMKQGETADEQTQLLQSLLEDSNARKNDLESENRIGNQRILALEAECEELKQQQQREGVSSNVVGESSPGKLPPPPSSSSSIADMSNENQELRKKLQEHKEKLRESETELSRKKAHIDDLEPKFTNTNEQVHKLKDVLHKKEDEMRSMEERYRKYLEKAKSVIRTLDPKHSTGASTSEIQLLRSQLQEKQKLIEHLEHERDKSKITRDTEEKLVVSAWYNLGMQLHRKAAEDRLSQTGGGQSFLARQRQASSRRSQAILNNSGNSAR